MNNDAIVDRKTCFENVTTNPNTQTKASYINHTEYLFKLIDLAIDLKSPKQKIRLFNIYPNCYQEHHDIIMSYKDQDIEILDYDSYFKRDEEGKLYKFYNKNEDKDNKKAILLVPTTARTLANFQYDINIIFTTYMADEILFVLPNMNELGKNIRRELKNCKENNSISFKLSHVINKLFMNDTDELRKHFTTPLMIDNLFYPLDNSFYTKELLLCDYLIDGIEHFIVRVKYNNTPEDKNTENFLSDAIPYGNKYVPKNDQRGLYYSYNGVNKLLTDVVDSENFGLRKKIINLNYDKLIFNRTLSCEEFGIDYFFHQLCPYIRPNTKIVIIEEDMIKVLEDFEKISKNDPIEYWNLNTLLFGHNEAFDSVNDYNNSDCDLNQVCTTPELFDIYMTQEGLFEKIESTEPLKFSFSEDNKYTFMREYIRL